MRFSRCHWTVELTDCAVEDVRSLESHSIGQQREHSNNFLFFSNIKIINYFESKRSGILFLMLCVHCDLCIDYREFTYKIWDLSRAKVIPRFISCLLISFLLFLSLVQSNRCLRAFFYCLLTNQIDLTHHCHASRLQILWILLFFAHTGFLFSPKVLVSRAFHVSVVQNHSRFFHSKFLNDIDNKVSKSSLNILS